MAAPKANRSWSNEPFLVNGLEHRSGHKCQLEVSKWKINDLRIRRPNGTVEKIEDNEDYRLKFTFTGGTNDPSIELHFLTLPHPSTSQHRDVLRGSSIIFRYGAFVSVQVPSPCTNRTVHTFESNRQTTLPETKYITKSPITFSDSLFDLSWEGCKDGDQRMVKLSFKSKGAVAFGLSLLEKLEGSDHELARKLCALAPDPQPSPESYYEITVSFRYVPTAEFRYRYLLASPKGLQAFWRHRLGQNVMIGSVPLDLCQRYSLNSADVYENGENPAMGLPEAGSQVAITWSKIAYDDSGGDLPELYVLGGKVLRSDCKFGREKDGYRARWMTSIIFSQPRGGPEIPFLEANGYVASFQFSCQPSTLPFFFKVMDRLLFHDSEVVCPASSKIKSILMGRDNHRRMNKVPIVVLNENFVEVSMAPLDTSQRTAMRDLLISRLSIVQGLPGSGKTLLAVKFSSSSTSDFYENLNAFIPKQKPDLTEVFAVFTTVDELADTSIHSFRPTIVVFYQAEQLQDHHVFSTCGPFSDSIQKVAFFGDPNASGPHIQTGEQNHYKEQFRLSTMNRLCRIEHVASENIKAREPRVVIIDFANTFNTGDGSGNEGMKSASRIPSALMTPRDLRIIVGHERMRFHPDGTKIPIAVLMRLIVDWHKGRGLIKHMQVGEALLEYEDMLNPVMYKDGSRVAVDMYEKLRGRREARLERLAEELEKRLELEEFPPLGPVREI
ncbi:hypothetical protein DL98DRAFT_595551 [Cadophora sp. DSE1049]|nr:hypothetical protein DL98DRAFT_595551 [Cadophora sp. DSE1049]